MCWGQNLAPSANTSESIIKNYWKDAALGPETMLERDLSALPQMGAASVILVRQRHVKNLVSRKIDGRHCAIPHQLHATIERACNEWYFPSVPPFHPPWLFSLLP